MSDMDVQALYDAGKVPLHPIIENPKEKDVNKLMIKPKLRPSQLGDSAELSVVPKDLEGNYDYIADTKSMASGANSDMVQSRQQAIQLLTTNPVVLTLLQQEGYKPNIKEALVSIFEDNGYKDSERLFSKIETAPPITAGGSPGLGQPPQQQGIPTAPSPTPQVVNQQQMG
jgi:hypothetical protein